MNTRRVPIVLLVIIAVFFGLLGGVSGQLLSRVFLLQDLYGVPLFGEIDVPENLYQGSSLIIESPEKVIVEQNTKVFETVNSAKRSMVAIFEKIEKPEKKTEDVLLEDFYKLENPLAQAFVVTSDGWLISTYLPQRLINIESVLATSTREELELEYLDELTIITQDREIFEITDVEYDKKAMVSFWKIDSTDLPVRQFEQILDIQAGQLVLAVNWNSKVWLTSVADKKSTSESLIKSSDDLDLEIKLVETIDKDFGDGFLFNTEGDLIALLDDRSEIIPISSFFSCVSCLLEKKNISNSYLGINYIDLSTVLDVSEKYNEKSGALVYGDLNNPAVKKNSPAEIAGILEGDIIVSVNGLKVDKNTSLNSLIAQYSPGEVIDIAVIRGDENIVLSVVLDQIQD